MTPETDSQNQTTGPRWARPLELHQRCNRCQAFRYRNEGRGYCVHHGAIVTTDSTCDEFDPELP